MEELEQRLIQDKWVTTEQLALAAQESKRIGKSIWVTLVRLGILSEEDIAIFFAQESGIPYARISDYQISEEVIHLVDEDFCRENLILPLFKIKNVLFIACANPLDTVTIDNLMAKTGYDIEPLIAHPRSIIQAHDSYYGLQDRFFDMQNFIIKQKPTRSLPFYRTSKRIPLNLPVWISVEDEELALSYSSPIEGITKDISSGGTAIGLHVFLYIPKGTIVSVEFRTGKESSHTSVIKAKAEIVYCRMEKGLRYFLGVKFVKIEDNARKELLKLAEQKKLDF
jgi:hypothetical protein